MIDFFLNNYYWIFSGIGVAIISYFFTKKSTKVKNKISKKSKGIQAGRDVKIKLSNDGKK